MKVQIVRKRVEFEESMVVKMNYANEKKVTEMSDMKSRKKIVHLPKEQWQGKDIPLGYTTTEYYDVKVSDEDNGFVISMDKKPFENPVSHTPEEYDFPDKLYADYWEQACAWGIVENGELLAVIETAVEEWSNRLRVTELWITPALQGLGYGHALMEIAKERARLERRRAIILETQSCNVHAIGFYRHEGFQVIGMDTCCYTNRDIERREVRIEMGYKMPRKEQLAREDVVIRQEKPEDYHEVERMTQEAFNKEFEPLDKQYYPCQW